MLALFFSPMQPQTAQIFSYCFICEINRSASHSRRFEFFHGVSTPGNRPDCVHGVETPCSIPSPFQGVFMRRSASRSKRFKPNFAKVFFALIMFCNAFSLWPAAASN